MPTPETRPVIRIHGLWKSFNRTKVLRGIDLDLREGQTTVILGPSGCGKSVLLKHLVGLLKPDRGEIWFGGMRLDKLDQQQLGAVRQQIGFLFQQSALFDSLSVRENVAFPLREHAVVDEHEIDRRVHKVLRLVGLESSLEQMPADLSGGQRKRVALARAIVLNPKIVLYDEPTTGLDPIRADVINELILRLRRALGITGIVVTHDIASATKVGDRFIMMNRGRVHMDGTPQQFRETADPVVRRFFAGEASPEELAELADSGEDARPPRSSR